jgi:hypothetical protein
VVENAKAGGAGALDPSDRRFCVVDGIPDAGAPKYNGNWRCGLKFGSHQHGNSLNVALQHVETRWVVRTEPGFITVLPRWFAAATEHMEKNRLGSFGAPYPPYMSLKYRSRREEATTAATSFVLSIPQAAFGEVAPRPCMPGVISTQAAPASRR